MSLQPERTAAAPAPSVDVVVPCYGYGRYLRQCVESVLSQTGCDVRVLIVDDASPDDTPKISEALAAGDDRVSVIRHRENLGHIPTYNEGLGWASGTYVLLLSADDYLLPGALARSTRLLEENADLGFAFGQAFRADASGHQRIVGPDRLESTGGIATLSGWEFMMLMRAGNVVPTPTAVVRTELQKRVGGYRKDLPHAGDMEMWMRLASCSGVGFISAPQAVYRRHDANMSLAYSGGARLIRDFRQRQLVVECVLNEHYWDSETVGRLRAPMYSSLAHEAIGLASEAFNEGATEVSQDLSKIAADICPSIKRSWAWKKVEIKRWLGHSAWQALSSVRNGF